MLQEVSTQENLQIGDEARQAVAEANGMEDFDAVAELAGEADAQRFARNWTAMEFLKDNAVYK